MRELTAEEKFLAELRIHPSAGYFKYTIEALEQMVEKGRRKEKGRKEKDHEKKESR